MKKKESDIKTTGLAVGSPQNPILIGNFRSTLVEGALNIYYNIDLGQHKENMFDVAKSAYENLVKFIFLFMILVRDI